ncbi:hypothetical protein LGZ99_12335 [Photorhabdus temperata]|uniref:Uncharacterized protein n=1 Tax=Photorhabdus temperata subsp. temperata Meg1 TaxID=1393735 RepID=A0A081RVH5_PHOTE|nr:hypothetical protein [Photorhabdus temperata]KER02678.1 hypothetical protein MEG1DRAFT_02717 [Photorhabdus temperata subsp. temperata Meg1]MCT8347969.1 hypothetical protein [Photorhabdus temperata]
MNKVKKIFSREWFKDLFLIWFKDLLWSTIPVIIIFVWSMMAVVFFPDIWGWLALFGVIVVFICLFVFSYISEKRINDKRKS